MASFALHDSLPAVLPLTRAITQGGKCDDSFCPEYRFLRLPGIGNPFLNIAPSTCPGHLPAILPEEEIQASKKELTMEPKASMEKMDNHRRRSLGEELLKLLP